MNLNLVPKDDHGNFFTGDAYLVMYNSAKSTPAIHSWVGSEATQDESGAVAILMVQMDNHLGGGPRQYTEFQNDESNTFLKYFGGSIKYKKGGVASGFKDVDVNDFEDVKRVMHLKGRSCVRATEVNFSWDSFNSGDCFIIDLGKDIYHWSGSKSNSFEKLKSKVVAKDICDSERRGRATVHSIDEGQEPKEVLDVLGPKPDVLPEGCPDTTPQVSRKAKCEASLYMISDAAGSMKATLVAEKAPFKQDMLNPNECYIVDNKGNHKIFVWKGPKANNDERNAANTAADKFIKDHDYPVIMAAGAEDTLFKEFFFNWMDKGETVGLGKTNTRGTIAKVPKVPFDASSLHENKTMTAQHGMVDDGSGKVEVQHWSYNKVAVDPSKYGHFYGGDCYLIKYSYKSGGRLMHIIYNWQGNKCSVAERTLCAHLTVQLDDSMGGAATQVRVTQGEEPAHLVSLFKGKLMVVYLGGSSRSGGQTAPGDVQLFHIRLSSTNATRAVEVEPTAAALNTNDAFVLKKSGGLVIWKGEGAADEEMESAKFLAKTLGGSVTEVKEKSEPDSFWAALGGKTEYQTSKMLKNVVKPPRLFECSNKTGRLIVSPDLKHLYISNTHNSYVLFFYLPAQEYIDTDPSGRRGIPIVTFKQGQEPPSFTGWFQAWDPNAWDSKDHHLWNSLPLETFLQELKNNQQCEQLTVWMDLGREVFCSFFYNCVRFSNLLFSVFTLFKLGCG
uniref:Scinderin like a n=1 Tax=Neogobius melanostomus TaxID=47308 RepID=A0A8C6WFR4_9GOBI